MDNLWKLYPNESGSLDRFAFVRWYVDEEVSLDSSEEAECLVGWGFQVRLMDLQGEIFLKVHSLNREHDQENLYFKEIQVCTL